MNRFSKRDDARHAETACVFRELNEEIAAIARSLPDDELPAFLCECGAGCTRHVSLTLAEYEQVRSHPLRFFVVHGHDASDVDVVVEETERFCIVEKQAPVTEVLLVLDATTGQNGLQQARVFREVVDVTGIVLTKLDGSAKGGIVVAVQRELGVPVKLVGLGEGADDLAPFDPEAFVDALLGDTAA